MDDELLRTVNCIILELEQLKTDIKGLEEQRKTDIKELEEILKGLKKND